MNAPLDSLVYSQQSTPEINLAAPTDRRADIDAKQVRLATLLPEVGCEGLLVLDPDNFAWLTAGGAARGSADPADLPALYFSPEGRWALCSNVDSQRLFDEELDGLGFQLKEWPWHWGRTQLLADLCQGRKVGCDVAFQGCKVVADHLRPLRRQMSSYEQACYRALGQLVSHALEATCRTLAVGETEREVAGQLSHRLLHRGAYPVLIGVAADGRARHYRQFGFTSAPIRSLCVVRAVARKYGLCAAASRTVCLGPPDAAARRDHDTCCKVSASYIASSWPDAMVKQILGSGRRFYQMSDAEHEWLQAPQGNITGRAAIELPLLPTSEDLLRSGWVVTWHTSAGAALSCDTFLITDDGPRAVTAPEHWPLKRIRLQGAEFVRPDLLIRS
jgi:Xaa-Pro aminopeptidase